MLLVNLLIIIRSTNVTLSQPRSRGSLRQQLAADIKGIGLRVKLAPRQTVGPRVWGSTCLVQALLSCRKLRRYPKSQHQAIKLKDLVGAYSATHQRRRDNDINSNITSMLETIFFSTCRRDATNFFKFWGVSYVWTDKLQACTTL